MTSKSLNRVRWLEKWSTLIKKKKKLNPTALDKVKWSMEFVNVKFLEYTASHESIELNHSSFCPRQNIQILLWPGLIEINCLTSGWNQLCRCILDDSMWFQVSINEKKSIWKQGTIEWYAIFLVNRQKYRFYRFSVS